MSFQIQQQIKNNAADIKNYVEDLYEWEKSMGQKEKQKSNVATTQQSVPVRGKADINVSDSTSSQQPESKSVNLPEEKNEQLIRDKNSVKDYYNAWNKFDVDKEIDNLDQKHKHDDQSKMVNPYEAMTSNKPRAAPRAQIKISSQRSAIVDINSLKDKANLSYQSLDFKGANELYTQCVELLKDQKTVTSDEKLLFANIYSNRAMTNIKLQEYAQAELDGTKALEIDSKHIKSYLRRGTARKKLQKIKEAHEDFKAALQIQPDNKEAQKEVALIETALNERKQKAQQGLLLEGRGDDHDYDKLEIGDISGSDIGLSDSDEDEDDDDDDEEDIAPVENRFTRLSIIDKKVTHEGSDNNAQLDRKRSVLFSEKSVELSDEKQYSYHQDEIPEYSILKNSHDLGHLVKNIDSKLLKHDEEIQEDKEDGSHTVKFKGAEVPTQTFTPRHNLKPRNSILKNSPLVAENFHAQIKDIDGKLIKHHSKFKDEGKEDNQEDHEVHFKKHLVENSSKLQHHSFSDHPGTPKKHILKHNLNDDNEVEQLHNKYFQEKKPEENQGEEEEEASFAYTHLKNIDGKPSEHHRRSPRHKPQFQPVEDHVEATNDDDDDDKKVHFGQAQNLRFATEVPSKAAKPRHSILKSQGNQNNSVEILQLSKFQEEQKKEEDKVDNAIEQGKQKLKEVIIVSTKSDLTSSKFLSEWENLKNDQPHQLKYLMQVDPLQLTSIFKEGIELPVLNEMFQVLNAEYTKTEGETIKNYILQIPTLKRFKLSISLLSAADKKDIKEIIEKLSGDGILKNDDGQKAKDLYKIK